MHRFGQAPEKVDGERHGFGIGRECYGHAGGC